MFFKFNKKYLSLLVLFLSISFYSSAQLIDLDAEDNDVENIKSRTGEIRSEENFLGKGTYKEVFKFNWDDKGVAVVFFTFDDKGLTALTREVNFYNIYVHENLIKAFAYSKISRFIILELATNSLDKYFRNNKQIMGMEEKLNYFLDISKGLQYLHNNNVIHRDMKLANIVLVNDPEKKWFVAKLIDFDYSVKLNEFEVFEEGYSRGTTGYKAPEILKPFREIEEERDGEVVKISTYRYTRAVDVYALGNIFYKMLRKKDFYPSAISWISKNIRIVNTGLLSRARGRPSSGEVEFNLYLRALKYKKYVERDLLVPNYENIWKYFFKNKKRPLGVLVGKMLFLNLEERPDIGFITEKLDGFLGLSD